MQNNRVLTTQFIVSLKEGSTQKEAFMLKKAIDTWLHARGAGAGPHATLCDGGAAVDGGVAGLVASLVLYCVVRRGPGRSSRRRRYSCSGGLRWKSMCEVWRVVDEPAVWRLGRPENGQLATVRWSTRSVRR